MKYSALIGNPVEHSIAPQLFDVIAKKLNIQYSHLKIKINTSDELEKAMESLNNLDFVGFNITIPYKIDIYNILTDKNCDSESKKMHSVNSVVIKNGQMKGFNTDGKAAIESINHFYNLSKNDKVLILGAGGAAHSILYEISKITKNISVFNENLKSAVQMCELICREALCFDLNDTESLKSELNTSTVVINATSVGMVPNVATLLDDNLIKKLKTKKVFFDVVFNPWETQMIKLAKKYGHIVVSGGYMLIYQALLVLEVWLEMKINFSKDEVEDLAEEMISVLGREKND